MPAEARVPGPTDRDAGIDRFLARGSGARSSSKEAQRRETGLPERKPNRWPRLRIGATQKPRAQKTLGRVAGQFEGARKGKECGVWSAQNRASHRIHFDSRLCEVFDYGEEGSLLK